MLQRCARAVVLVLVLALAGCQAGEFAPTRADATPFAAADSDCWDYSGNVAPDDTQPAMYAKCMARHGWVTCGQRRRCEPDTW
jgi:hypothetical protein